MVKCPNCNKELKKIKGPVKIACQIGSEEDEEDEEEDEKGKLIIEFRNYLEGFIKRYKDHSSLNLLDISIHLKQVRTFEKELKKFKDKK